MTIRDEFSSVSRFRAKFQTLSQLIGEPDNEEVEVHNADDSEIDARIRIRLPVRPNVNRNSRAWQNRFDIFRRAGFDNEESAWAADQNLRINNDIIRAVVRARRSFVRDFMSAFGANRAEAVRVAAEFNRGRNVRRGAVGRDIYNVFREISP